MLATIEIVTKQDSSRYLTLAAMSLGYGVVQLDVTIVYVAIDSTGHSLGRRSPRVAMGGDGLHDGFCRIDPQT
jgi:hypothetical protein